MMERVPSAHISIGNGHRGVHNHGYDFNDAAIPCGLAYAAIVEKKRQRAGVIRYGAAGRFE